MKELKDKLQSVRDAIDECIGCCNEFGKPQEQGDTTEQAETYEEIPRTGEKDKSLLKKTLSKKLSMISGDE